MKSIFIVTYIEGSVIPASCFYLQPPSKEPSVAILPVFTQNNFIYTFGFKIPKHKKFCWILRTVYGSSEVNGVIYV